MVEVEFAAVPPSSGPQQQPEKSVCAESSVWFSRPRRNEETKTQRSRAHILSSRCFLLKTLFKNLIKCVLLSSDRVNKVIKSDKN